MKFIRKNGRIIPIKDKNGSSGDSQKKAPQEKRSKHLRDATTKEKVAMGAFAGTAFGMFGASAGALAGGIASKFSKSSNAMLIGAGVGAVAGLALGAKTAMGMNKNGGGVIKKGHKKAYQNEQIKKLKKIRKGSSV